jgi:hypothetical protein
VPRKPAKLKPPATVSKLKQLADSEFSRYIRYRDGKLTENGWWAVCITCDKWFPFNTIQAGHFQSRRFNITRFDEQNVNAQCKGCNIFRYGEQYKYAKALDIKYGEGTADKLVAKALEPHKFLPDELIEIAVKAKEQAIELENSGIVYE